MNNKCKCKWNKKNLIQINQCKKKKLKNLILNLKMKMIANLERKCKQKLIKNKIYFIDYLNNREDLLKEHHV